MAATIAAFCPHHFRKMVLVGATGIKPPEGEIFDMFMETASEYIKLTVADSLAVEEFSTVCPPTPSTRAGRGMGGRTGAVGPASAGGPTCTTRLFLTCCVGPLRYPRYWCGEARTA